MGDHLQRFAIEITKQLTGSAEEANKTPFQVFEQIVATPCILIISD
jgi:hypothetical protein